MDTTLIELFKHNPTLNHAPGHRAHVASILSQIGVAAPALDGWAFAVEGGLPRPEPAQ